MHRLYAKTSEILSIRPGLDAESAAHLRVLRPRDGETFEFFDGRGLKREFVWRASGGAFAASGEPVAVPPQRPATVLFACVTKGQRWDWTLEKSVELGVSRIVPVLSERTVVRIPAGERERKRERWAKIAMEAARQSDAVWIPEVSEPLEFEAAADEASRTVCFAGALATPPPEPMLAAVERALAEDGAMAREFSVFIGPEGDFTPAELSRLLSFAVPVSLGGTVLRAETAAMHALGVLKAAIHAKAAKPEGGSL